MVFAWMKFAGAQYDNSTVPPAHISINNRKGLSESLWLFLYDVRTDTVRNDPCSCTPALELDVTMRRERCEQCSRCLLDGVCRRTIHKHVGIYYLIKYVGPRYFCAIFELLSQNKCLYELFKLCVCVEGASMLLPSCLGFRGRYSLRYLFLELISIHNRKNGICNNLCLLL